MRDNSNYGPAAPASLLGNLAFAVFLVVLLIGSAAGTVSVLSGALETAASARPARPVAALRVADNRRGDVYRTWDDVVRARLPGDEGTDEGTADIRPAPRTATRASGSRSRAAPRHEPPRQTGPRADSRTDSRPDSRMGRQTNRDPNLHTAPLPEPEKPATREREKGVVDL